MNSKNANACVKIAACICGKDGVISKAELEKMFEVVSQQFPTFGFDLFEEALDEFFGSDGPIEEFLAAVDDKKTRQFALDLSEVSAAADGLDTRENIALEKAYLVWGIERRA